MLRRAYASGPLDTFCPQPDKDLTAVRLVGGGPFLFAKFSWRKNSPSGCILRGPCFCNLANRKEALICPARVFWHLIRLRVGPGKPIFSAVNRRNYNRILKAVLAKLRIPEADRYSFHAFRRGGSQELKESGPPPWSVVASSGVWHSPAFRGYVDSSRDVELGARQLFDVLDSQSDDEGPLGTTLGIFWRRNPLACLPRPLFHGYRGFLSLQLAVAG